MFYALFAWFVAAVIIAVGFFIAAGIVLVLGGWLIILIAIPICIVLAL